MPSIQLHFSHHVAQVIAYTFSRSSFPISTWDGCRNNKAPKQITKYFCSEWEWWGNTLQIHFLFQCSFSSDDSVKYCWIFIQKNKALNISSLALPCNPEVRSGIATTIGEGGDLLIGSRSLDLACPHCTGWKHSTSKGEKQQNQKEEHAEVTHPRV